MREHPAVCQTSKSKRDGEDWASSLTQIFDPIRSAPRYRSGLTMFRQGQAGARKGHDRSDVAQTANGTRIPYLNLKNATRSLPSFNLTINWRHVPAHDSSVFQT